MRRKAVHHTGTLDSLLDSGNFRAPRKRLVKTSAFVKLVILLPVAGALVAATCIPFVMAFAGTTDVALTAWQNMPHDLGEVVTKQRTVLLDRNGKQFGQLFTEDRVQVKLADVSPNMVDALIATEDSRFYLHGGLDVKGTGRALVNDVIGGGATQGASTLTQQLVENLRTVTAVDAKDRQAAKANSIEEKVQELRYAVELEKKYTKDQILEMYLNTVYFGNGTYGVSAAAQRYFSTTEGRLSVDQSATLVAMLKSPTGYDPIAQPDASLARRNTVLQQMVTVGTLEDADYQAIAGHKTRLKQSRPKSGCASADYPYYCSLVLSHMLSSDEFGKTRKDREKFLARGGLTIKTALDPRTMKAAQKAVDRALGQDNRVAAGVAVLQPGTGRLLGIAQNRSWGTGKHKTEIVYPAATQFQPGSTFKPITTATALEQGVSAQTRFNTPSGLTLKGLDAPPGGYLNDDRRAHGSLDVYGATKGSVNTWFVQLLREVGVKNTAEMARRLGMYSVPETLNGREGSLTLGAYETSPIQVATVYATFAARGVECDPVLILKAVISATGKPIAVPDGNCHQAILPAVADTVADTLRAPFQPGGTASALRLDGGRKSGGKTGTTNSHAATWFAGFTPQAATAVWIGDPRGGNKYTLRGTVAYGRYHSTVYGGTVAGPIWKETMNSILRGRKNEWVASPHGVSTSLMSRIVPTVVGMKIDEAVTLLTDQGFVVKIAEQHAAKNPLSQPGHVAAQTPKAGNNTGSGVTLTLTLTDGSPAGLDAATVLNQKATS